MQFKIQREKDFNQPFSSSDQNFLFRNDINCQNWKNNHILQVDNKMLKVEAGEFYGLTN